MAARQVVGQQIPGNNADPGGEPGGTESFLGDRGDPGKFEDGPGLTVVNFGAGVARSGQDDPLVPVERSRGWSAAHQATGP